MRLIKPRADAAAVASTIIVRTLDEHELVRILEPQVQAVVYAPPALPAWMGELAGAVAAGEFRVRRTILGEVTGAEIAGWLEDNLPVGVVAEAVRDALVADVLALVERQRAMTESSRFMLRIFTGAPTRDCGFHVDTVPPGAPRFGLLRVYNGAGTDYVEPAALISMRGFYRYASRRERLAREWAEARAGDDESVRRRALADLVQLDEERAFLAGPERVETAPAGAIVAFRHLDVRHHWSTDERHRAWIHCSPMQGEPRLVVNVTAHRSATGRFSRPGGG
ncbi:DUF1826 domain-containing protein [Haliangium sp.]|uniref:DUF1826 domain-containing protein n=1 Tax=Haliangium sp. TaxID=2663208 RepID=UPI003D0E1F4A